MNAIASTAGKRRTGHGRGRRDRRRALAAIGLAALLAGCSLVRGGKDESANRPAPLFEDLGSYHHPITTDSDLAQKYFDQGLILAYGFNHAEAERSFRAATEVDPSCAMCFWGVALALGPNINKPMASEDAPAAYEAAQRALELAPGASPREQAYVQALAQRYAAEAPADRAPLDRAYADAMAEAASTYPDDLDLATLYAEALMDLQPWDYWDAAGKPKGSADQIVAVLEQVLAAAPNHPGALHLYIHAVEASSDPQRGEVAADRLGDLVPGAGHLVHMPAHIYLRIGRYADASEANVRAAAADESYITQCNVQGFYPALYYPHNIHFLWLTASIEGRYNLALESARKLSAAVTEEQVRQYPEIEWYLPTPLFTLARFERWDDILVEPAPPADFSYNTAVWHYARGLAYAAKGNVEAARSELAAIDAILETPAVRDYVPAPGQPPTKHLIEIAENILTASVAEATKQRAATIAALQTAVRLQDALPYMEPPYWYYPVRQSLGAAYLRFGEPRKAEAVFRRDLEEHPDNGWSLFGLAASLDAQGRSREAAEVHAQFEEAWRNADTRLVISKG